MSAVMNRKIGGQRGREGFTRSRVPVVTRRAYIVTWMENGHERVKSFIAGEVPLPYRAACQFARSREIDVGAFESSNFSVLGVERVS